jgi:hypothetical protein
LPKGAVLSLSKDRRASPPHSHLLGTVSAGDHDPAVRIRQPPAQVEQQANRRGVRPLQVVQDQQQWLFLRDGAQHIGDLLEEVALFHVLRTCLLTLEVFPQTWKPGSVLLPGGHRPGQERPLLHKDIHQMGIVIQQRLDDEG